MGKKQPGQAVTFSAREWNNILDAVRQVQYLKRQVQGLERQLVQSGICLIKNDSGEDLARYTVLKISDIVIKPTDNELGFKQRPALVGIKPEEEDDKFCVLYEPIKNGQMGRAVASGLAIVKVDVQDEDHTFAQATPEQSGYLTSSDSGSTEILWKEEGTGQKWAIVRIGSGGAGSSIFGCILTSGVSSGTATAQIVEIDDYTEEVEASATVYSPGRNGGIFKSGKIGSDGIVEKKKGKYMLIQLNCGS